MGRGLGVIVTVLVGEGKSGVWKGSFHELSVPLIYRDPEHVTCLLRPSVFSPVRKLLSVVTGAPSPSLDLCSSDPLRSRAVPSPDG